MLNQISIAFDLADQIRLIAAGVEIAVPDLPVIIGANRVIALADMNQNVHIIGKPFDRHVDRIDRSPHLLIISGCEIWLIDLNMLAPRGDQPIEVLMQ
jgi:hypothetical protein